MNNEQNSLTTQNRLIIFGLILSTFLIVAIAVFAIFNIQKRLNEGYQNFGKVISKALAIESVEIIRNIPDNQISEILKKHSESILKSHSDIVLIEFRDKEGNVIYSGKNNTNSKNDKTTVTVSSPMSIRLADGSRFIGQYNKPNFRNNKGFFVVCVHCCMDCFCFCNSD